MLTQNYNYILSREEGEIPLLLSLTQGKLLAGLTKAWVGSNSGSPIDLTRYPDLSAYNNHIDNYSNPHGVSCAQIGAAVSAHNHDGRYAYADHTHSSGGGIVVRYIPAGYTEAQTVDFGVELKAVVFSTHINRKSAMSGSKEVSTNKVSCVLYPGETINTTARDPITLNEQYNIFEFQIQISCYSTYATAMVARGFRNNTKVATDFLLIGLY